MAESSARTLADQFRAWSDEELTRLLQARPDLAAPAPQDSAQLASRAGTRASVLRAVENLGVLDLAVLDAAVTLGGGPCSLRDLQDRLHAEPDSVAAAVTRLRALALLWGPVDQLRALSVVADVVGTSVSGLGPSATELLSGHGPTRVASLARALGLDPTGDRHSDVAAVTDRLADPAVVQELVAEVEPRAKAILDHLERDGAPGTVESTERPLRRTGGGPVDQLLARGLVLARDRQHVMVPREVALFLRGGRTTRHPVDVPPELVTSDRDAGLVDRAAAGAAFELTRHVELLLEHWGHAPPAALRSGGLGVRDLRAVAQLLHTDDRAAAFHVEVAAAAGLLAVGDTDEQDAAWLPTDAFDVWSAGSAGERWAALATAWLESPRVMSLVGSRDAGRKPVNALMPELDRSWAAESRRLVLEVLAGLPAGEVLAAGTGVPSLVERVRWLRPRRPAERATAVAWFVEESALLGVTGLGGLSTPGRALLGEEPRKTGAKALEPLLPEPVDHVLLQADLTAVAPGPLTHDLAHRLALLADIESRGGATVYRFTATSVRRAFDSGWSSAEVHAFLASASRTPVPQPLVYLVDDVARRFGTVRVGAAGAFVRSDDEHALAELVHDPRAAALRLRRIAPSVLVTDLPVDVLLARLRELGVAPVVEAPDGTVAIARRDSHRARTPRRPPPGRDVGAARHAARAAATVGAIRAGDRAAESRPRRGEAAPARGGPMATMAALREAVEAGATVWIGYLDNHGSTVERIVDPVKVEGGWLTAYDHRADDVRAFAVHRITSVGAAT